MASRAFVGNFVHRQCNAEILRVIGHGEKVERRGQLQLPASRVRYDLALRIPVGCAGDDLRAGASSSDDDPIAGRRVDLDVGPGPVLLLQAAARLRDCPKPTVALLHGHALGSGYDYSLSCDFRLATEDVNYGDPRIHRALWAAEGWSYKLPRLACQAAVASIAYLGETMDGRTAHARGLVHAVYAAGSQLRQAAQPFIEELAMLPPSSYAATKALLLGSEEATFEQALAAAR